MPPRPGVSVIYYSERDQGRPSQERLCLLAGLRTTWCPWMSFNRWLGWGKCGLFCLNCWFPDQKPGYMVENGWMDSQSTWCHHWPFEDHCWSLVKFERQENLTLITITDCKSCISCKTGPIWSLWKYNNIFVSVCHTKCFFHSHFYQPPPLVLSSPSQAITWEQGDIGF